MAKKSKKRRAWTATEVRELKSMAKKKTAAAKDRQEVEADGRRHASEGVQHRAFARLPFLNFTKQPILQMRIDAGLDPRPGAMSFGITFGRGKLSRYTR